MAMRVQRGEFFPVGKELTIRQEMQYRDIWASIRNYGINDVMAFSNKIRVYTEGENAAILQKKDPRLLKELREFMQVAQRLRAVIG